MSKSKTKQTVPNVDQEYAVQQDKTLHWLQKNQKTLLYTLLGLALIIGGYYAYQQFVVKPNTEKAQNDLAGAQQLFDRAVANPVIDTAAFKAVLNGEGATKGVLSVIKNNSGKVANLAKYYAGVSYLKLGDFNNAVKYLKEFSTDAKQIQMMAYGALGDAYSELGKNDDAVSSYKKAAATFEADAVNAGEYLFRAALLCEVTGKNTEAVQLYKELKEKFPQTQRGAEADKYIYRLSIEDNDFTVK